MGHTCDNQIKHNLFRNSGATSHAYQMLGKSVCATQKRGGHAKTNKPHKYLQNTSYLWQGICLVTLIGEIIAYCNYSFYVETHIIYYNYIAYTVYIHILYICTSICTSLMCETHSWKHQIPWKSKNETDMSIELQWIHTAASCLVQEGLVACLTQQVVKEVSIQFNNTYPSGSCG